MERLLRCPLALAISGVAICAFCCQQGNQFHSLSPLSVSNHIFKRCSPLDSEASVSKHAKNDCKNKKVCQLFKKKKEKEKAGHRDRCCHMCKPQTCFLQAGFCRPDVPKCLLHSHLGSAPRSLARRKHFVGDWMKRSTVGSAESIRSMNTTQRAGKTGCKQLPLHHKRSRATEFDKSIKSALRSTGWSGSWTLIAICQLKLPHLQL